MLRLKFIIFILVLILSFAQNISANNFADTYGFSAKGMSMGNAMTAISNDWTSVWYNVAGLGRTVHLRDDRDSSDLGAEMTLQLKQPASRTDNEKPEGYHPHEFGLSYFYSASMHEINGGDPTDLDDVANKRTALKNLDTGFIILGMALDINAAIKMPKAISSFRLGFGAGMVHDGSMMMINDIDTKAYNFIRYGRECQKALILAGIGMGFLNDMFGFGIGINASFKGKGKVILDDLAVGDTNPQSPGREVKMNFSIDPTAIAGLYFSPGKITGILKGLHFGASYRMESKISIDPFETTAYTVPGGLKLLLELSILDYYTPHTVTTGVAYTIIDKVTLSFDFEYQLWSEYEFIDEAGVSGMPSLLDIYVIRTGINYDIFKWIGISAGYYYQPSMIPDNIANSNANVLDNDKHVVSLGLSGTVPKLKFTGGPIIISVAYQLQYLVDRSVTKADPADNYKYGGMCHTAMLSLSMRI